MSTPFKDIYDKFLSSIDDYELAFFHDDDLSHLLQQYLSKAIYLDFKQCTKDLSEFDAEAELFKVELSIEEQWIIATGMTLSWLEPKIKRERLLRDAISDRDYRESSHALQLRELMNLESTIRDKLHRYIVSYTHNNFDGLY